MSDYNKTTDFAAKDAANAIIDGNDYETEFDNISTSIATKANKITSGNLNNVIKQDSGGDLVDSGYSFSGLVGDTAVTKTELDILDGCTATTAELNIMDGVTATTAELNIMDGVTSTTAELNILDGVTSTTAELNLLDGVTSTTAELNKLDGATASTAELNYVTGVTSAIQTQLNTKAPLVSPTFTGTPSLPTGTTGVTQTIADNSTKLATTEYADRAGAAFRGALANPIDSTQSAGNNTWYVVQLNSEQYDTDTIHDTVTNNTRLTVPSGVTKVKVSANVVFSSNSTGYRVAEITLNGINLSSGRARATANAVNGTATEMYLSSAVMDVTAGDYFELEVWQNSGGSLTLTGGATAANTWAAMEIIE